MKSQLMIYVTAACLLNTMIHDLHGVTKKITQKTSVTNAKKSNPSALLPIPTNVLAAQNYIIAIAQQAQSKVLNATDITNIKNAVNYLVNQINTLTKTINDRAPQVAFKNSLDAMYEPNLTLEDIAEAMALMGQVSVGQAQPGEISATSSAVISDASSAILALYPKDKYPNGAPVQKIVSDIKLAGIINTSYPTNTPDITTRVQQDIFLATRARAIYPSVTDPTALAQAVSNDAALAGSIRSVSSFADYTDKLIISSITKSAPLIDAVHDAYDNAYASINTQYPKIKLTKPVDPTTQIADDITLATTARGIYASLSSPKTDPAAIASAMISDISAGASSNSTTQQLSAAAQGLTTLLTNIQADLKSFSTTNANQLGYAPSLEAIVIDPHAPLTTIYNLYRQLLIDEIFIWHILYTAQDTHNNAIFDLYNLALAQNTIINLSQVPLSTPYTSSTNAFADTLATRKYKTMPAPTLLISDLAIQMANVIDGAYTYFTPSIPGAVQLGIPIKCIFRTTYSLVQNNIDNGKYKNGQVTRPAAGS